MQTMTFSVKESQNADTAHEVVVTLPSFEEATEAQRKVAWDFMSASSSPRVRAQSAIRNLISKGTTGDALNAAAQSIFEDLLAGRNVRASASTATVIDASTFPGGLDAKQIAALEASGAIVINKA